MKKSPVIFLLLLLMTAVFTLQAQEVEIDEVFKKSSITTLNQLMNDYYVFPEVAKKTEDHLNQLMLTGHFVKYNDLQSFAEELTAQVQVINKDKHMRIRPRMVGQAPPNTVDRMFEEHLDYKMRSRSNTAGFMEAKKFPENVGYLDLRGFAGVGVGGPVADHYMALLAGSDAIIIDLRKNGGGDPSMVQYLCSYFFDKKVHLNSLYWREGDRTDEFWTFEEVNGNKMADVPLFVLTSNRTFSGAEEFSYNMQTQKRATLVGETTGGGANPGGTRPINDYLSVFIPAGKAINPVTGTNWEGVGVVPEVKVDAEEALAKGLELATAAAAKYRAGKEKQFRAVFDDITKELDKYTSAANELDAKYAKKAVLNRFETAREIGLFNEEDINYMGYSFLGELEKPEMAEVILWCNTKLYPESANVYDSYAEALATKGDMKEALDNYKKAVELAMKNNDPQLELFKSNLKKVEDKIKP